METLKVPLRGICEASGGSVNVVYDAIAAGHLKTFLVGRRRFARPKDVRAWIDMLEAESNAGRPVIYRARSAEAAQPTAKPATKRRPPAEPTPKRKAAA